MSISYCPRCGKQALVNVNAEYRFHCQECYEPFMIMTMATVHHKDLVDALCQEDFEEIFGPRVPLNGAGIVDGGA